MSAPAVTVGAMASLAAALDVVFPRRCAGCGDGPWPFCSACRAALQVLEPPWCERCGRPNPLPVPSCRDCPPEPLCSARAPFRYEGPAKAAIHRLKFTGWRDVASALASAMGAMGLPHADVVTWVPLARRRLAERGYDQARALAVGLGRELGIPVDRLLRRVVATPPQARRSGAERRRVMQGVFAPLRPAPSRVLLVDDVLTTGATAAACAEVLRSAGAREVHLAASARSVSNVPARSPSLPAALREGVEHAYPRQGPRPGLWLPGDHPR
jgi:ComF family protein